MSSMVIVEVNVAGKAFSACIRAVVREAVHAFAKKRLNEPLGLAIRTRPIRPRTSAADPQIVTCSPKCTGDVASAVVGQHALNRHMLSGKPPLGTTKELRCCWGVVCRQHLHIRNARMVVDSDVHPFPSR